VREAEEGDSLAEGPALPGCVTQGENFDDLLMDIYQAVDACLSVDLRDVQHDPADRVLDIAV